MKKSECKNRVGGHLGVRGLSDLLDRVYFHRWGMQLMALALGFVLAAPAHAYQQSTAPKVKAANKRMAEKGLEAKISPNEPPSAPASAKQADRDAAAAKEAQKVPAAEPVPVPIPNLPEGAKPVIKTDEATHSFGTVWVGPVLKHEFTLRNEGSAPLEITKVRPACGCTIAGTYPKTLAPGESGKFPFSLDSNKLRGKFEKSITVSSNDPSTPDLQLKLAGECQRYVDITPPQANFSRITDQDPKEQKIVIINNGEAPLQLTVTPPPAGSKFTCELAEKTPGKNFELTVRANPPFEPGTLRDVVSLTTNVEAQKSIQIPVNAIVPERFEVQPSEVAIGSLGGKGSATATKRQLRFNNYGANPAKILKAEADDEKLKVTVSTKTEGKEYTIDVEWPADYVVPESGKKITLTTDDATKPTIEIPVKPTRLAQKDTNPQRTPAEAMIGRPAPAFNLKTTEGKELSLATTKENITVMTFFAPNCGFCKKLMPRVETLRPGYTEKGVRFVNVCQTMKKEFTDEETIKILSDIGVKGELAIDKANSVGPLFGANSYPTMVIVGKSGIVETVNVGNIADLESKLSAQLDALLAGKPIPADLQAKAPPPAAPKAPPASELLGKPAPEFALKTLQGKSVANTDLAASAATVLNFVAPNCGYCKKQLPRIESLKSEYVAKGVRFVNVSETMGNKVYSNEEIVDVLSKTAGSTNEIATDEGNKVGQMFRAQGFPTMVIVGKDGKVAAVNSGNLADLETRMKGQLDAIIAGKPVPTFDAPAPAQADAKPATPQRPAMELVGKPAPKFSLNTMDGKTLSDAEFSARPATVLNFFAPNCGFCKKQIPVVESIRKEYEAKGVRFVNMSETMRKEFTNDEVMDVLKGVGWTGETAIDGGNQVGQSFKAISYPTMVIVGKDGNVAQVNIGAPQDFESKLRGQLDSLISGKPIAAAPPAAPVGNPAPNPAVQPVPVPAQPAPKP